MANDINLINSNLVETNIELIGNKYTIEKIILLLAYIRNSIQTQKEMNITVKLNKNFQDPNFTFSVNEMSVMDRKALSEIEIN